MPIVLSRLKSNVDKLDNNIGKTILLKRLNMINWLKTLMKTTDTSCLVKKAGYYTKPGKIENKILHHDHDKYITTQEFNKLTADNFLRD